jgi:hypothetical protein
VSTTENVKFWLLRVSRRRDQRNAPLPDALIDGRRFRVLGHRRRLHARMPDSDPRYIPAGLAGATRVRRRDRNPRSSGNDRFG